MWIVLSAALGGHEKIYELKMSVSRIRERQKPSPYTHTCAHTLFRFVKSLVEFLYIAITTRNCHPLEPNSHLYLGAATGVQAANLFFVLHQHRQHSPSMFPQTRSSIDTYVLKGLYAPLFIVMTGLWFAGSQTRTWRRRIGSSTGALSTM